MALRDHESKTPLNFQIPGFLECVKDLQEEDGIITTNELKRCDPSPIQLGGYYSFPSMQSIQSKIRKYWSPPASLGRQKKVRRYKFMWIIR